MYKKNSHLKKKNFIVSNLDYKINIKNFKINKSKINDGLNLFEEIIAIKDSEKNITFYDRNCDHSGGKLISTSHNQIICPLHGWKFDPYSGKYTNVKITKKKLEHKYDGEIYNVKIQQEVPHIKKINKEHKINIEFLNHACIFVDTPTLKFATDPWLIGPAFTTGWYLSKKTSIDAFDKLNNCNFIYISHNHPDHLHPLTLSKIKKDMVFVTPNFKSSSTKSFLNSLGFKRVITFDFNKKYFLSDFNFTILKSGDFRDDSGILFNIGNFKALFTVDSNFLNFNKLPSNLTLLASSFAGGASGFPLCFENINHLNKKNILNRNINAIKLLNENVLKITKPKYFLPYAGFFTENAKRDSYIKQNNIKNNINDYKPMCQKNHTQLLNLEDSQKFYFHGEKITSSHKNIDKYLDDFLPNEYIANKKKIYSNIDKKFIKNYFIESGYRSDLNLIIKLMNDNFSIIKLQFDIDFQKNKLIFKNNNLNYKDLKYINQKKHLRVLQLKIRSESFLDIIYNGLPWEDFLIGFQTRVDRFPNIYNSDFWYHFTNIYIKKINIRSSKKCGSCELLNQELNYKSF